jgi:glutamate dehydrogenase/leucine dehydrogenase
MTDILNRLEGPAIQQEFIERDTEIAERIGYDPDHLNDDYATWQVGGEIEIPGVAEPVAVGRYHVGPNELVGAGGMKYKLHATPDAMDRNGYVHAYYMDRKAGVLNENFAGHKSMINADPRALEKEQLRAGVEQKALFMANSGLLYYADKPAGDEGTNPYIDAYWQKLEAEGFKYPWANITGKSDMLERPSATGDGAGIVLRNIMRYEGKNATTLATQGLGFAGAYLNAEAANPRNDADRAQKIAVMGAGDMLLNGKKVALVTSHPDGLPFNRDMVKSILTDPTDRDMKATKGDKALAFAAKFERMGHPFELKEGDILTNFKGAEIMAPAATSGVITEKNMLDIECDTLAEQANNVHTIAALALFHEMASQGQAPYKHLTTALLSAGGVKMSFIERRRDMERIAAEEAGLAFTPNPDEVYYQEMRDDLERATTQTNRMAEVFGFSNADAVKAVSMANRALRTGRDISDTARNIMLAA